MSTSYHVYLGQWAPDLEVALNNPGKLNTRCEICLVIYNCTLSCTLTSGGNSFSAALRGIEKPPWVLVSLAVKFLQRNSLGCLLLVCPVSGIENISISYRKVICQLMKKSSGKIRKATYSNTYNLCKIIADELAEWEIKGFKTLQKRLCWMQGTTENVKCLRLQSSLAEEWFVHRPHHYHRKPEILFIELQQQIDKAKTNNI